MMILMLAACGPSQQQSPPPATPLSASAQPAATPAGPRCSYVVKRVSAAGRGAMRPQIAAGADAFAVVWEETSQHRAVMVQTFGLDAQPLGPALELGDAAHPGAEPRVVALPASVGGFAAFWSTEQTDTSLIDLRKIDRAGRFKSDVVPVVVAPGARTLAAGPSEAGFAVAWWNWSGVPHQLAVSFLDQDGRALGRPSPITRLPSPDPTVDVWTGAAVGARALDVIAWEELVDGVEHVVVGEISRDRLAGRVDVGPGETPELGRGLVVFERATQQSIYSASLVGGSPVRITDGHVPAAAPRGANGSALCWLRDTDPSEEVHLDELTCGDLVDGKIVDGTRIAVAPRGIFAVQLAVNASRIGVAWQSQEEDDTAVSFASLSCPEVAASTARR